MDLKNRKINQYRCIAKAGQGGFSEIWKAAKGGEQKGTVAIKLMKKEAARDKKTRGLFAKEWKIARSFDHPGTLKYLSYGVFKDLPYLAMEFFDGASLRQLIQNKPDWVRANSATIFKAACESL
ncbi:MAG: protein kinase domain-containing protein, partial [Planctomycetota bacterium]